MASSTAPSSSQTLIHLMMMTRQRSKEQAEAVVDQKILSENPKTLSELTGLLIDALIEDLYTLEQGGDFDLTDF